MTSRTPLWERLGSEDSESDAPSPPPHGSPRESQLEVYRRELQKLHSQTPYSASVRRFLEAKIAEIVAQKQQGNASKVILSPASPRHKNTPRGPEFNYEWSPASTARQRRERQSRSVERLSRPRSASSASRAGSSRQRSSSRDRFASTNHLGRQRPDPAVYKPYRSSIQRTDRDVLEWVEAQHMWAERVKARRLLRQEELEREEEARGRPRIHNKTLKLQDLLRKRSRSADSANRSISAVRRAVEGYTSLRSIDIEEYLMETNVFERLFKVKDTYSARRRSMSASSRYSFTPKLCKRSLQLVEAKSEARAQRSASEERTRQPKTAEEIPFRPQLNRVSLRLATLDGETFNERLARSVEAYRRRVLECHNDRVGPGAYTPKYDVVSPNRTRRFRKPRNQT